MAHTTSLFRSPDSHEGGNRPQEKPGFVKRLLGSCLAAVLVAGPHSAHALTVFVERLIYTENGSIAFQDEFNDPLSVPAFSNGTPGSYVAFGSPGPEANGKLRMSTDDGRATALASGVPVSNTRLRLNDNIHPSVPTGIRPGIAFGASALFDLPVTGFGAGEGFSLRLGETASSGDFVRTMRLRVGRVGNGAPGVVFRIEDYVTDTVTTVYSAPLLIPGGADQMLLLLDRRGADTPVTGSFRFFSDGAESGLLNTSGVGITPFLYADRMNVEVVASKNVVPVPGSLVLLLSGVAVAGLAARKRGRKSRTAAS
jgi:hypothetical protein